jgi:hypothetical protein
MCTFFDQSAKIMEIGCLKSYGSHIWGFANETIGFVLICKKTTFVLQWISLNFSEIGLTLGLCRSKNIKNLPRVSTSNLYSNVRGITLL